MKKPDRQLRPIIFSEENERRMQLLQEQAKREANENDRSKNSALYDGLAWLAQSSAINPRSGLFELTVPLQKLQEVAKNSAVNGTIRNYFENLQTRTSSDPDPVPDFLDGQISFSRTEEGDFIFRISSAARVALTALQLIFFVDQVPTAGYPGCATLIGDPAHLLEEFACQRVLGNNPYELLPLGHSYFGSSFVQLPKNFESEDSGDHTIEQISLYALLTRVMEKVQAELDRIVATHKPDESLENLHKRNVYFFEYYEPLHILPEELKQAILNIQNELRVPTQREIFEADRSYLKWIPIPLALALLAIIGGMTDAARQNLPDWYPMPLIAFAVACAFTAFELATSDRRYDAIKSKQRDLFEGDLQTLLKPEVVKLLDTYKDLRS